MKNNLFIIINNVKAKIINKDIIPNLVIKLAGPEVDESNELFFCGGQRLYKLTSDEGDLNNDNILNVLDVILLVNLILSQQYNDIADFNNDQVLNVLDVITLINIILE